MYHCKSFPFLSGSLLCLPSLSSLFFCPILLSPSFPLFFPFLSFLLPPFPPVLPPFLPFSSPSSSHFPPSPLPFSSLHSSRNAQKSYEQFYKLNYHHPYLGSSHQLLRQPRTLQCELPRFQGRQPGILVAKGGSCDVSCDHTLRYVCNLRKINLQYWMYMCVWRCVGCELTLEIAYGYLLKFDIIFKITECVL